MSGFSRKIGNTDERWADPGFILNMMATKRNPGPVISYLKTLPSLRNERPLDQHKRAEQLWFQASRMGELDEQGIRRLAGDVARYHGEKLAKEGKISRFAGRSDDNIFNKV